MKIYSFWSGDTTYFTKSKNLKKAQAIGREVKKHYLDTCKYLGEEPNREITKDYFIPEEVEEVSQKWFNHLVKTDPDILILDYELESLVRCKIIKEAY